MTTHVIRITDASTYTVAIEAATPESALGMVREMTTETLLAAVRGASTEEDYVLVAVTRACAIRHAIARENEAQELLAEIEAG